MPSRDYYDAIVIGSGPNGLSAAIALSSTFRSVLLVEAKSSIGGGVRSAELTLPGFVHDICSAVHPLAISSPFFRRLALERYGLAWIHPEIPVAHPFEDGTALFLHRSLEITCEAFGEDGRAYKSLVEPFVKYYDTLLTEILKPIHIPKNPYLMLRFAAKALGSAKNLAYKTFRNSHTRALFAGLAAHAMIPLEKPLTASFGIILAILAHAVGWPIIKGGSQRLADALSRVFMDNGGEIETDFSVSSLDGLPRASYYFFDVTPRQLLNIEGIDLTNSYRARLRRFRYGPGVQKVDWALRKPIPWKADICKKAGTVHIGNTFEEIDSSIQLVNAGETPDLSYVIVAQQTLFDATRAPEGMHTAWAYCHVPNGASEDIADRIEDRIEQYAPGFKGTIMARHSMSACAMEQHNPNYVGGDINGGTQDLFQLYTRPTYSICPYRTSAKNIYICSSSTPPGGGVHGLCGYYATKSLTNLII